MPKTAKSNGTKAPPPSPLGPRTPLERPNHPPQPITMKQLQQRFMDNQAFRVFGAIVEARASI
ncbi:hypothetical protein BDBG_16986 [Blastomyces gilchristii SLH14081]|uniref:Uncharacterized protein n=1 Tax=Blastomyces gilchristii (strain SLH14081) TaxID=559298 RepID=A0A179UJJ4_BLAGS|nr:uncharacterized protein BDBG_16986 [Blastomyces gilchristii SLH14081]OAT08246.1 hypothetical protein BDBG_16986 [Blastomyces gilchristii SLH14081]